MPLIDTESRTGTLVAAVNHLLAEGGPRALSLRAVARVSRVSTSSILHHLGSVEHLMRVSAHWTGRAARAAGRAVARRGAGGAPPPAPRRRRRRAGVAGMVRAVALGAGPGADVAGGARRGASAAGAAAGLRAA